jgi:hypothetical protein
MVGLSLWLGRGPRSEPGGGTAIVMAHGDDFSRWQKTELVPAVPGGAERVMAKGMRDATPSGEPVIWAAPGARWEVEGPSRVRLSAGEIYVQTPRTRSDRAGAFEVATPVGEVTARRADFFIKVQASPPSPKKAVKEQVVVTVQDGEVELTNPQGRVRGSRGQSLRARAEEKPIKESAALRKPPDAEPAKKKEP